MGKAVVCPLFLGGLEGEIHPEQVAVRRHAQRTALNLRQALGNGQS